MDKYSKQSFLRDGLHCKSIYPQSDFLIAFFLHAIFQNRNLFTEMSHKNYAEKYTKPELRRKIKQEIMESDKGGKPGQWSARKSQLLVQEYEKRGGGYQGEKDEAARSLEEWTEQNWQTQEEDGKARKNNKTKRYLPQEVWERLSEEEKQEVEENKQSASQQGEQYAEWTTAVKRVMGEIQQSDESQLTKRELYQKAQELEIEGRSKMDKSQLYEAIEEAENSL